MYYTTVVVSMVLVAMVGTICAKCVPPQKGFHYVAPCEGYEGKTKITVTKITANQKGHPVDQGLDLTVPLTLAFNTSYKGKPIRKHLMDQRMYKYTDTRRGCGWEEIDTSGITDDVDACRMIKNVDCSYATHPSYVVSVVDWQDLYGDSVSALQEGTYYAFKSIEKDGNDVINCFWIQAKILKSS